MPGCPGGSQQFVPGDQLTLSIVEDVFQGNLVRGQAAYVRQMAALDLQQVIQQQAEGALENGAFWRAGDEMA